MPEAPGGDAAALLDAAEMAFARRGIHGPSLREVTIAAGVRNKSAVQYHFGSRQGLLAAVLARRAKVLRLRRRAAIDASTSTAGAPASRDACRILVEPFAAFLDDGPGALAYLVIADDVMRDPSRPYQSLVAEFDDPLVEDVVLALLAALPLPRQIAEERVLVALSSVIASVATRARRQLEPDAPRALVPTDLFVANLIDMTVGALDAPVSPATAVHVHGLGEIAARQRGPQVNTVK